MKENFLPIDLLNLKDRALAILDNLKESENIDRSEEYRTVCLSKAKNVASTLVSDFNYYLDTKLFNGREPMGLEEARDNLTNSKNE